jgi:predicted metalloprotease with PDZ domain
MVLLAIMALTGLAHAQQDVPTATYELRMLGTGSPRVAVRATLPSDGAELSMATSRPGNVPEVADAGWPALVKNLKVTDANGDPVDVTSVGAAGWTLARSVAGLLTLEYEVDYTPLAARGWPAQREAAFADDGHLVVIGRSLFIQTPVQHSSEVRFVLPRGWEAIVPWSAVGGARHATAVASREDLSENLVAIVHGRPDVFTAGGFNLKVVALGHWQPVRAEIRRVLELALQRLIALIGFDGHADYLVVLMPDIDRGGESFRASFALTLDEAPSNANLNTWGNLIAHEVFHYWNGWRLQGADYPSSQWFQEGFTEYAANLALVSGGLSSPAEFYAKLAAHVDKYRRLETPLDAPGTRKGPPLYSGGALVAFIWDTMIGAATDGEQGVGAVLRALLRDTNGGEQSYTWLDIEAALEGIAPGDWAEFQRRYIHGTEPLPLESAFGRIGLRMSQRDDGSTSVDADPAASPSAQALRRALMSRPPRR